MISNNRGQALVEAMAVIPALAFLILVAIIVCWAPLMVYAVEDQMEEALQCSTFRDPSDCKREFEQHVSKGPVSRWYQSSSETCDKNNCQLTVLWKWPKPLPQQTSRSLVKDLNKRDSQSLSL